MQLIDFDRIEPGRLRQSSCGSCRVPHQGQSSGKEPLAERFICPNRTVGRKGRERRSAPGIEVCPSERRFNAGQGFRMMA